MLASTSQHLHQIQGQSPQRSSFGIQQLLGLGSGSPNRQQQQQQQQQPQHQQSPPTRPSPTTDFVALPPPPPPAAGGVMGAFSGRTPAAHVAGGHCFPGSESQRLAYLNSAALMSSSMHPGSGNAAAAAAAAAAAGVSMSMFHSFPGDSFTRNDVCSGKGMNKSGRSRDRRGLCFR